MCIKQVVFITTSNLAANPRLVKEIELARDMNFKISVIQFLFQGWSCELTKNLMSKHSDEIYAPWIKPLVR
jgi:hypothetical protein